MNNDAIRVLLVQGLAVMKTGGHIAATATGEIRKIVRHPDLAIALDEGHRVTQLWNQRIEQALHEVGYDDAQQNPVIGALHDLGREVCEQAPDDASRDLGIIANGRLSVHYWIAAFGTMRAYAEHLGMRDVAKAMQSSLEEATRIDEVNTRNAKAIMSA